LRGANPSSSSLTSTATAADDEGAPLGFCAPFADEDDEDEDEDDEDEEEAAAAGWADPRVLRAPAGCARPADGASAARAPGAGFAPPRSSWRALRAARAMRSSSLSSHIDSEARARRQ